MEITIPKTKAQQDFEANVQYLITLFTQLDEREQKCFLIWRYSLRTNNKQKQKERGTTK